MVTSMQIAGLTVTAVLLALTISALTNPQAQAAKDQLNELSGSDAHFTVILSEEDENLLKKAEKQITAFSAARVLFAAVAIPGFYTQERIDYLKHLAISYVDEGMEPLCF